jgi:hypothetical protein
LVREGNQQRLIRNRKTLEPGSSGGGVKSIRLFCALVSLALAVGSIGCTKPAAPSSSSPSPGNSAGSSPAPGGAQPSNSSQNPSNAGGGASASGNSPQQAAAPEPIVIPAGKIIRIRLAQPLGSKESQPGETFSATIAEPVQVDGRTVIERGAAAHGEVVDAKAMGHFKGGALLQVRVDSVVIQGREHPVDTSIWSQTLSGKGKRSTIAIGGGAGLGAALGGIFGGGKGAAIGALAGGGAGTAGAAYTGNKEIHLPEETVLGFRLKQPVEVR